MSNPSWVKQFYFISKDKTRAKVDPWEYERNKGRKHLSSQAQLKLEWIIFYHTLGNKNAKFTAAQFGITRKTIHKWLKRYKEKGLLGLEEISCAPVHVR